MSDFEGKSWVELHAMIAGANPKDFHARAAALHEAAEHMDQLSQELGTNVKAVEWQGESGDAFHSWTQQLVTTTSDLATYTKNVAKGLGGVGDALGKTVAGIPKPPATTITASPYRPYQPVLNQALPLIDNAETNEAINLMSSLSSSYSTTAADFKAAPPVFKPMPAAMVPADDYDGEETQIGIGNGSGNKSGTRYPSPQPSSGYRQTPGSGDPGSTGGSVRMPRMPQVPGGKTTLDSGPTMHHPQAPQAATVPGSTPGGDPTGRIPRNGYPGGLGFGTEEPDGGPPVSRSSGRRVLGGGAFGDEEPGYDGGFPGEDGITGGALGGRHGGGSGRGGLVVGGEEEPPTPRVPGIGSGIGNGPGSGGYGRYPTSPYGGSGAASEADGYAGSQYGSGSARSAAEEEQGGMTRSGMGGVGGLGSTGYGRGRQGRSGSRPDYVVEDEETWMTGGGNVPPVID